MSKVKQKGMRLFEAKPKDKKFVMMSRSMLQSPIFQSMSYSSMVLYMYMRLHLSYSGQDTIDYALSYGTMQSPLKSKATVDKAIDELIKNGFIELLYASTGGGHTPRRFKFSSKWIELDKIYKQNNHCRKK